MSLLDRIRTQLWAERYADPDNWLRHMTILDLLTMLDYMGEEDPPTLVFKRLVPSAVLPSYQTAGAAGMDVRYCVEADTKHHTDPAGFRLHTGILPGGWAAFATGLSAEIPTGYELQVRPRSGIAASLGVTVLNAPGTIDSDYRGQIKVLLINHGKSPFYAANNDRIAQLVLAPVAHARIEEGELTETERGAGGFGSTGR